VAVEIERNKFQYIVDLFLNPNIVYKNSKSVTIQNIYLAKKGPKYDSIGMMFAFGFYKLFSRFVVQANIFELEKNRLRIKLVLSLHWALLPLRFLILSIYLLFLLGNSKFSTEKDFRFFLGLIVIWNSGLIFFFIFYFPLLLLYLTLKNRTLVTFSFRRLKYPVVFDE
jgi:hypothetical protein